MPISALTRGGTAYTPEFLIAIDAKKCIGCGRCYKVCGRDVMTLKGVTDEVERKVMVLADADACIGCGACARVCPKDCQTHAALE